MISKELINKYKLDEEELDLLNEENDIVSEKEQEVFFEEAIDNLKKNKLISLRVNSNVIENIKKIANDFGLSYQSYIGILLNQVANGNLRLKVDYK